MQTELLLLRGLCRGKHAGRPGFAGSYNGVGGTGVRAEGEGGVGEDGRHKPLGSDTSAEALNTTVS